MTPLLNVTPIYAALLALLFIYLSFAVIKQRRANKISLGDGDVPSLRKAIAVHNNFSQYVPFALLLIAFVELNHGSPYLIHGLGASLFIGRLAHAYGLAQANQIMKLRQAGMVLTLTVIIFAALLLIRHFFAQLFSI
jgi:uncharacterized protein